MSLKFIVEDIHQDIDFLVEEKNKTGERKTFITGPFMMAGNPNGNGRSYNIDEMIGEVARYEKEMIQTRRAIGEMNHPQSTEVNPVNACHLVVELKRNGNYFMGKSQVLSTPMGRLLENFIQDNIKMGISTRGLGTINETSGVSPLYVEADTMSSSAGSFGFGEFILASSIVVGGGTLAEIINYA